MINVILLNFSWFLFFPGASVASTASLKINFDVIIKNIEELNTLAGEGEHVISHTTRGARLKVFELSIQRSTRTHIKYVYLSSCCVEILRLGLRICTILQCSCNSYELLRSSVLTNFSCIQTLPVNSLCLGPRVEF